MKGPEMKGRHVIPRACFGPRFNSEWLSQGEFPLRPNIAAQYCCSQCGAVKTTQKKESHMPTITLQDQSTNGTTRNSLTLDLLTESLTVRELIRARVYQEVQDFNRKQQADAATPFNGLVQPTNTESTLNGYEFKPRASRQIDWKPQFEKACEAFENHAFLLLVDNRQLDNLDEQITLRATSTVTFLKLLPLVGG
jgi:hypothetical protein